MKVSQTLKDPPHKSGVCRKPTTTKEKSRAWPNPNVSVPVACQAPGAALGRSPLHCSTMVKRVWLTFRVKEWDDAQLTLGHIKCVLQVMPGIGVL